MKILIRVMSVLLVVTNVPLLTGVSIGMLRRGVAKAIKPVDDMIDNVLNNAFGD